MKKSVLLFLACSVLLLAACQKTPESVMDGNVIRAKSSNDLLVDPYNKITLQLGCIYHCLSLHQK